MPHTRRAPIDVGTCRPNRALPPKWCSARARTCWRANALHYTSLFSTRRWTQLNFGFGIHGRPFCFPNFALQHCHAERFISRIAQ